MQLAYRSCIVHLEGLFHGIRFAVRLAVFQQQPFHEVVHLLFGVNIFIASIRIACLRLRIDLIGESDHPLLVLSGRALIVDVSIDGIPGAISMIAGPIAVGYVLMVSTIHGGKSITIIFTIAAIHSKSHRQQP